MELIRTTSPPLADTSPMASDLIRTVSSGLPNLPSGQEPSRNPATIYLASLSPSSRPGTRGRLAKVIRMFTGEEGDIFTWPWHLLRYPHLTALRSKLAESALGVGHSNVILSCVRSVLRECWRLGLLSAEDFHRAIDVKPLKGSTIAKGRALETGEVAALFAACAKDRGPAGDRDAGILAVLLAAGLRRQELVDLDADDYDESTGTIKVRHGKGNRGRVCYLCRSAREILHHWIRRRGLPDSDVPPTESEIVPLFGKCRKGPHGRVVMERLSTSAVYRLLNKRARQGNVKAFSPHDLRRTFCSDLLSKGADLAHTQRLMGHSSPSTTSRYDLRPEAEKRKAAELLVLPFYR